MPYSLSDIKELATKKELKIDWTALENYWRDWSSDGNDHNIRFSLRGKGHLNDNEYGGFIEFRKTVGGIYFTQRYEIKPSTDSTLSIIPGELSKKDLKRYKK